MTKGLKRTAGLGAVAWVVLMPATPALTQAICGGTSQTFTPSVASGSQIDGQQPYFWVTPAGVTSVVIRAAGAQGGTLTSSGGKGAEVTATYPVTPGERLCVVVGVAGQDAGGHITSGGGGSFVFSAGFASCAMSNVAVSNLLVAAGGGGSTSGLTDGMPGRATGLGAGAAGALDGSSFVGGPPAATGGAGGGGATGGGGGGLLTNGQDGSHANGGGALNVGGAGGDELGFSGNGGFGGGGSGGGGGGYNGGGGATADVSSSGGGGGSFSSVVPTSATDGVQTGNGEVTLCYTPPPAPVPTLTEWAMIGLTGVLALCGLAVVERRRRFPASGG